MNKRNKGISLILLLIIITVVIVIVTVGVISFYKIKDKNQANEEVINNNKSVNNTINENNEIIVKTEDKLNNWNGTYENEDYSITLYRTSESKLEFKATNINKENLKVGTNSNLISIEGNFNISSDMRTLDITSDTNISYNQDDFGIVSNISIERTNKGIKITSSSTEENSILNKCSGEYTKKEFTSANWDGVYKNGDNVIVLAQYEEKILYITVNESWGKYTQDFDEIIEFKEEFFGKIENLKITKTQTGIEVEAISNEEGSLLEGINGSYIKQ